MRNLFLSLVLANVLFLAWQLWVDPSQSPAPPASGDASLVLYGAGGRGARQVAPPQAAPPPVASAPSGVTTSADGSCLRVGPLPDSTAAQQAAQRLAGRGIDAVPIARDSQQWLGHWVQVAGFSSVPAAEAARQRLVAGGMPEALLMQNGAEPLISLGVFRDRAGADRVAAAARSLGFQVLLRDRYRPAVEQWLLVRPRPGQALGPGDVRLADARILRAEEAPCGESGAVASPGQRGPEGPGTDGSGPRGPD